MKKYFDSVANTSGKPVSGAFVQVYNYGTTTASSIFSDAGGTVPITNPVITNSTGYFEFYAADGRYTLSITGPGISGVAITDVLLDDPANASAVNISGGTINATPIGATTPSTGAFTTLSTSDVSLFGGGANKRIQLSADTANTYVYSNGEYYFGTNGANSIQFVTNNVVRASLDTSGNLGLGVTPSYKFDVASSSDAIAGNFRGRSADGISVLRFADNANTETARIDVRTTGLRLTAAGTNPVTVNSPGGLGYGTGAGGTVTQLTSKSTPVTLNTPTGRVTTFNDSLAAGAQIGFSINNSLVALTDTVVLTFAGTLASVNANYSVRCAVGTGTIFVTLKNESAGALLESVPINFAIIKGVTA